MMMWREGETLEEEFHYRNQMEWDNKCVFNVNHHVDVYLTTDSACMSKYKLFVAFYPKKSKRK